MHWDVTHRFAGHKYGGGSNRKTGELPQRNRGR